MSTTTVYPNGDGTKNGWIEYTPSFGNTTNIYANIDEGTASPNDSDYISGAYNAGAYYVLLGDMPSDFGTATSVSIKVRSQYSSSKLDNKSFNCQLVQSNESTAITGSTNTAVTGSFANYTISPSITGSNTKTVWDGMRLKLTPQASSTGGSIFISAVQIDITYSAAGITATPTAASLTISGHAPSVSRGNTLSATTLATAGRTPSSSKSLTTTACSLTLSPHAATGGFVYVPGHGSLTITAHAPTVFIDHTVAVTALPLYINAHSIERPLTTHYAGTVTEEVVLIDNWFDESKAENESDAQYAYSQFAILGHSAFTSVLDFTNFGYSSGDFQDDHVIKSIEFTLLGLTDTYPNNIETKAWLLYNGSPIGTALDYGSPDIEGEWRDSPTNIFFHPGNDWGSGITISEIIGGYGDTFGMALQVKATDMTPTVYVDSVYCKIIVALEIPVTAVELTITPYAPAATKGFTLSSAALTTAARVPATSKALSVSATSLTISAHAPLVNLASETPHWASLTIEAYDVESEKIPIMAAVWSHITAHTPYVFFSLTPAAGELTIAAYEAAGSYSLTPARGQLTVTARQPAVSKTHVPVAASVHLTAFQPNTYKGIFVQPNQATLTLSLGSIAGTTTARVTALNLTVTARRPIVLNTPVAASLTVTPRTAVAKKADSLTAVSLTLAGRAPSAKHTIAVLRRSLTISPRVPRSLKSSAVSSLQVTLSVGTLSTKQVISTTHTSLTISAHAALATITAKPRHATLVLTARQPASSKSARLIATGIQLQSHFGYTGKRFSVGHASLTTAGRTPGTARSHRPLVARLTTTARPPVSAKQLTTSAATLAVSAYALGTYFGQEVKDSEEIRKRFRAVEQQAPSAVRPAEEIRKRYRATEDPYTRNQ